jgi:hypothetical protein
VQEAEVALALARQDAKRQAEADAQAVVDGIE